MVAFALTVITCIELEVKRRRLLLKRHITDITNVVWIFYFLLTRLLLKTSKAFHLRVQMFRSVIFLTFRNIPAEQVDCFQSF